MKRGNSISTRFVRRTVVFAGLVGLALPAMAQQRPAKTQPPEPTRQEEKEKKIGQRLVRKSVSQSDEGIMAALIRMMDEASEKLDADFDTGSKTQTLQKQIMERLDEAIALAAKRKGSSKQRPRDKSDKRRKTDPQDTQSRKSGERQSGDSTDAKSKEATPGKADAVSPDGSDAARDARRTWGHLPDRERDEVIQGVDEEFLEAYRMWIERYYRALQESHE